MLGRVAGSAQRGCGVRDERLRSHHRENYYQWDVRRAFAPSPPPQPALDRIAADADESERRGVEWRERALRAEAGVAELTKRIEKLERDHAVAVGELISLTDGSHMTAYQHGYRLGHAEGLSDHGTAGGPFGC